MRPSGGVQRTWRLVGVSESMKRLVGGLRESVAGIKSEQRKRQALMSINRASSTCCQAHFWMHQCSAVLWTNAQHRRNHPGDQAGEKRDPGATRFARAQHDTTQVFSSSNPTTREKILEGGKSPGSTRKRVPLYISWTITKRHPLERSKLQLNFFKGTLDKHLDYWLNLDHTSNLIHDNF